MRWLEPVHRRRRRRVPVKRIAALVLVLAAAGTAAAVVQGRRAAEDDRRTAAASYAQAWARGDLRAAWAATTAATRAEWPLADFRSSDRAARREVTATAGRGRPRRGRCATAASRCPSWSARGSSATSGGRSRSPCGRRTTACGSRGGRTCGSPACGPASASAGACCSGRIARRCSRPTGAASPRSRRRPRSPGSRRAGDDPGSGLEARYDARLGGRPGAVLRYGDRVIARVPVRRGHRVRSTIRPSLQRAATAALGGQLGGVAVIRPRTGDVLALAGLAVSAPQPPGSTFKIVTLAAALQAGVATPASS